MRQVDRYKRMIVAKLDMLQAQHDYRAAKDKLHENILVSELNGEQHDYRNVIAEEALAELVSSDIVVIEKCDHVQAQLKYKDVDVYLHDSVPVGSKGLYNIINEG